MSAPSPSAVGNKFVVSYYTQLNQNPGSLRHFYKENAVLTHGSESSFGASDETVSGVEEINKKIQKLDFRDCHVTLSVVDCQASQSGILVLVVGHLSNKAEPPRKFVQTFFLSEHNKAFFVQNDVFRFVEESKAQEAPAAAAPEPAAKEEPAPQPITQEPPHPEPIDTKPKEIKPSAPAPSSLETSPEEQAVEPVVPKKVTAPPPRNETWNVPKKESSKPSAAPAKKVTASPPPPPQEEKPTGPKSWSNVVGGASGGVVPQSSPPVEAAAQPAQGAKRSTPQQPQKQRREKVEDKTATPSLFINNVPFGVSEEQMKGVFSQFGEIKSVSVAGSKGFAFLEFATVEQAQKAIDGAKNGQLSMDGRVLIVVESKKDKKQGGSKDKGSRPPRDRPDRLDRDKGERRERGDGKPSNGKQFAAKQ